MAYTVFDFLGLVQYRSIAEATKVGLELDQGLAEQLAIFHIMDIRDNEESDLGILIDMVDDMGCLLDSNRSISKNVLSLHESVDFFVQLVETELTKRLTDDELEQFEQIKLIRSLQGIDDGN